MGRIPEGPDGFSGFSGEAVSIVMLSYIIPVIAVTVMFIIYGILNVEDDAPSSSGKGSSGCERCGEKDSCASSGHDDFVHFEIHKPDMNPAEGLFGRRKKR